MKTCLLTSTTIFIVFLFTTSCQKSVDGGLKNTTPVDSTITDTTLFIDFMLDAEHIFQISSTTADSNANWKWYPLIGFWDFRFPDTVHYQFSSLKGGLTIYIDTTIIRKGFYFLKNNNGQPRTLYFFKAMVDTPDSKIIH